jgi:benzodiazapine receptor
MMKILGTSFILVVLISTSYVVHTCECFQLYQVTSAGGKQILFFHHQRRTVSASSSLSSTILSGLPTTLAGVLKRNTATTQRNKNLQHTTTALPSTATDSSDSSSPTTTTTVLDTGAIVRYVVAFIVQMSLIMTVLKCTDRLTQAMELTGKIPFGVNCVLFYFLALKSRIFNPMSNTRPTNRKTKEVEVVDNDNNVSSSSSTTPPSPIQPPPRKMPTWTPPGIVFPIVWLLIIGPLRAVSSSIIYKMNGGVYADMNTIGWLMVHLSIGDVWNTINNIERRYGTSVLGVLGVWISAAVAAYHYYQVSTLAGIVLSIPVVWLTIATSLIFRTWQINPNPITGTIESWIPTKTVVIRSKNNADKKGGWKTKGRTVTKLIWFEK